MIKKISHMNQITLANIFGIIYIIIMGVGMSIMHYLFNYSYENPEMIRVLVFFEIVLTFLVLFYLFKFSSWKKLGFGKLNIKYIIWIIPILILISMALFLFLKQIISNNVDSSQLILLGLVFVTTFLVGFSEELMFRGIILRAYLKKFTIIKSVVLSSVFFSLLHGVNVLGGSPIPLVAVQLILTFIFGLFASIIAIKTNNLWVIIIFHWLWDFTTIGSGVLNVDSSILIGLMILFEILIAIILFIKLYLLNK